MLLYNVKYNSYVVVEIKCRKLKKEDKGQVEFYMNLVDNYVKEPSNNPTIGIIITKDQDKFVANFVRSEKLVPLTIDKLINKQKIPIYGNGKQKRDWTHVYDICDAIDLLFHKGNNGELYCIGGDACVSNIEIVHTIINEYAGKEALGIKFISEPEDKLTIFANVFKESPFSFSYPIRSIGYCERQIAEYNLTTEEQIACIFHEIGHIVRGSA